MKIPLLILALLLTLATQAQESVRLKLNLKKGDRYLDEYKSEVLGYDEKEIINGQIIEEGKVGKQINSQKVEYTIKDIVDNVYFIQVKIINLETNSYTNNVLNDRLDHINLLSGFVFNIELNTGNNDMKIIIPDKGNKELEEKLVKLYPEKDDGYIKWALNDIIRTINGRESIIRFNMFKANGYSVEKGTEVDSIQTSLFLGFGPTYIDIATAVSITDSTVYFANNIDMDSTKYMNLLVSKPIAELEDMVRNSSDPDEKKLAESQLEEAYNWLNNPSERQPIIFYTGTIKSDFVVSTNTGLVKTYNINYKIEPYIYKGSEISTVKLQGICSGTITKLN